MSLVTPEKALMDSVMLWCGQNGYYCFRCNVGLMFTKRKPTMTDSDWVCMATGERASFSHMATGLPKGFSDLLVIRPGKSPAFVETKVHPRKPTEDQVRFIEAMRSAGCSAGVAYSLDEARKIIEGK